MTKISIPVNRAYDAIMWASKHFDSAYHVQHMMPDNMYEFKFERAEQASLFALRWMWLRLKSIGTKINHSVIGMTYVIGVLTNLVFQLPTKDDGILRPQ